MNSVKTITLSLALISTIACGGAGWVPESPNSATASVAGSTETQKTVARFQEKSPRLTRYFNEAYGVAVFPTVGKGAATVGGAYGKGEVFEQNKLVGSTELAQLTIGFAFGGQAYSELIFFEDKETLDRFKSGNFELGAQASAVAITAEASADASYEDGVAIFTMSKGGLMYEAAVAGQKFGYRSL